MSISRLQLSHLALVIPLAMAGPPRAQSGHGQMHGYVAFEDVSYNEVTEGKIHAKVELHGSSEANSRSVYTAETSNRGLYDFPSIGAGEFTLTISAPGYTTYRAELLIPSDFECKWAVMLRKKGVRTK